MAYTLYLLSLIISTVTATVLAFYLWRHRSVPGATPIVCLMLAIVVWSLGYVLQFQSTELSRQIFATNIQYLGIVTVPVTWLAFSLEYTGLYKWLTRRNLLLLAILPFVTVVLAWTNSFHSLMWYDRHLETIGPFTMIAKTYGIWFWVHTAYSYLLILLGTFILVQRLFRRPRLFRGQSVALVISVAVPLAWNIVYVFHLPPIHHLDLTPSVFTISGLVIAFGLFRFRLLDIIPVAQDAIIEGMTEAVIVLDARNRCVDINPTAQRIIGCPSSEAIGQPVARLLSKQPELMEHLSGVTKARVEVAVGKDEAQRYYESHISPLYDRHSRFTGRLVILCDITERKLAEEKLRKTDEYFRSLIENSLDAIVMINRDGTIRYRSSSHERILGYKAEEQINNIFERIHPDDIPEITAAYAQLVGNPGGTLQAEVRIQHKDGSWIYAEAQGHNLLDNPSVAGIVVNFRDITERKQAEEALRQSEEKLETILENTSDIIFQLSPLGTIQYVSPRAIELYGYKAEDLIGRHLRTTTHARELPKALKVLKSVLSGKVISNFEINQLDANGKIVPVEINATPVRKDGKIIALQGVMRDITQRKEAQDRIKRAAEEWRTTFDSITDLVFINDKDSRLIRVNKSFADVVKMKPEELIGRPCYEIVHGTNEPVQKCPYKQAIKTKKPAMAEFFEPHLGVHLEVSTSPIFDEKGDVVASVHVVRDITEHRRAEEELKESERRYRLLAENAKDVIWTVDMNMRPTYMSPSITHLLGYSVEEAMAKPMEAVYTPASFETAMKVLAEELATENMEQKDLSRSRMLELDLCRKDGSIVPIEGKFTFIRGPDKRPVEILVIARDVTERKRAEGELLDYQKELRSLASELSLAEERERRLIATEMHDRVGQNLAICRMKLGSLVKAVRSTRLAKPLSEIQTLIKGLIDEVRSLTFELSSPLLYELGLEAALEHLTEQMGKEHRVKFNFKDDGQPKPMDNDVSILLFQAVRELLINITKHAQARYARVRMERHDSNLRITVLDDGVGFDTSRISPGSKRTKGFGLFSIRERLHQIGGHIDIESEQGQGTQITLTAPLKQT